MTDSDLDQVYNANTVEEILDIYQDWANEYDRENIEKGYRLPSVAAAFICRFVADKDAAIYDAGCGTGLVGEALRVMGYKNLVGSDLSPRMVEVAKFRGVYTELSVQELGQTIDANTDRFDAATCFGSFGPGHAPPESLDELTRIVKPGGHVIFNLRYDTFAEQGFKAKISALSVAGIWREVDRTEKFRPYLIGEPDLGVLAFAFEILPS
jgi:predicted TPR repeat methyltransferase